MAWAHVRYSRGSFASRGAYALHGRRVMPLLRLAGWRELTKLQICLLGCVGIQLVQFTLLAQTQRLDVDIAVCVMAGLLIVLTCLLRPWLNNAGADNLDDCALGDREDRIGAPLRLMPQAVAPMPTGRQQALSDDMDVCRHDTWTDLMGRISHEIRTPLNAVIGFSELMSQETFGPLGHARYGDYVSHIKESGQAVLFVGDADAGGPASAICRSGRFGGRRLDGYRTPRDAAWRKPATVGRTRHRRAG
jgi:signal transduction histidine kinase